MRKSFCPFTAMQPFLGDVSLARPLLTSMLAKKKKKKKKGGGGGVTVFVRGCVRYHFDGLLSHLLVALHPLVLFIAT